MTEERTDARPIARLDFQDFADAHAFGVPPDGFMFWCLAKLADMDYVDFQDEGEERVEELSAEFHLIATVPPQGQDDAIPEYTEEAGIRYATLPLLFAAARPTIKVRRGTVRDVQETQLGQPGPLAQQRLLERLSGWEMDEIRTISLYDWNAIREARLNFPIPPSPEHSSTD